VSNDASTYDHFLEVAAGLGRIAEHIQPLQQAIRRDEVEILRLKNEIKNLEEQLEKVEDQYLRLERSLM
jgi:predicted  nucleic acid-binding Zn-ribbon protein